MKFAILSSILATSTAFHLPGASPLGHKVYDESRRGFLETAATMLTASVLTPAQSSAAEVGGRIQYGDESIMAPKAHGTSEKPVQEDLLYGVSNKLADKITNFNRHFAEMGGYFRSTPFEDAVLEAKGPVTFYDSVTGKPLFVAPIGRSAEDFISESEIHGWPSFRDQEVCILCLEIVEFTATFLNPLNSVVLAGCVGKCSSLEEFRRDCFGRWNSPGP